MGRKRGRRGRRWEGKGGGRVNGMKSVQSPLNIHSEWEPIECSIVAIMLRFPVGVAMMSLLSTVREHSCIL